MKHYTYSYVLCTCGSLFIATNKAGHPIYMGNDQVKFFECDAEDILQADKQLEVACNMKPEWNKPPWTQVVCSFYTIPPTP
jgi:hypothetical protein